MRGLVELPARLNSRLMKQTQKSTGAFSLRALQAYLTVNTNTSPFKLVFMTFAGFVVIHLWVIVAVMGMAIAIASCKYKETLGKPLVHGGPSATSWISRNELFQTGLSLDGLLFKEERLLNASQG